MRPSPSFCTIQFALPKLLPLLIAVSGCSTKPPASAAPPAIVQPSTPIIFQPMLEFADGKKSRQGTGFFVKTPDGRTAAVSCSHYLNIKGAPVRRASWLDVRDGKSVENFVKSWGKPGAGGLTDSKMLSIDLRTDFLVLPSEAEIPEGQLLQLDDRPMVEEGERVWFPNKNPNASVGYDLIIGSIQESHIKYHILLLEEPIVLDTQNGTPVISQVTGKVIGILSRDGRQYGINMMAQDLNGRLFLLTPSETILRVFTSYKEYPDLDKVTGNKR